MLDPNAASGGAIPVGSNTPYGRTQPSPMGQPQQASQQEQAQYEKFVAKAWDLVYDKAMLPKVVDMLGGEGEPVEGLARTTALVVGRVATAAEQAGEKLSGDVVLHAGKEIFEDLADLSATFKVKDYTKDPEALEGAYFRAMDHFRVMMQQAGRLDQGAAQKDMEMIQQMDESGEFEQMLRGLAEQDTAKAGKSEKPKAGQSGITGGKL